MLWLVLSTALAETVPLSQVLELAADKSPEAQIAELQAQHAQIEATKSLLMLAPTIDISGNWMDFGAPLEANLLGTDDASDLDCQSFEAFGLGDLCTSFSEPMLLREARIFDGTVQALWPISALYSISYGAAANRALHTSSVLETQLIRQRIQQSIIQLYLESSYLEQVIKFASESETRLEKLRTNLAAFVNQGLAKPVDLVRIEVAIADAQAGASEAIAGKTLLRNQLNLLAGEQVNPTLIIDRSLLEQPDLAFTQSQEKVPISVQQAQLSADAARSALRAAQGQMFPTLALVAGQSNTSGQGPLTPEQQRYIGVAITGKFDWGARILEAKQASIAAKQAQAGLQVKRDAIDLQLSSAKGALELAQTRLQNALQKGTLAEELLRQAEQTHQQQLLTTEALLEAETLVLEAHLSISENQKNVLLKYLDYRLLQGQSPLDIIKHLEKQNPPNESAQ